MYFITTIEKDWPKASSRCVGYYHSYIEAYQTVIENELDIHETSNRHVVIEKVREGLYPETVEEAWFTWIDGKYEETEKPEKFESTANWGIG